MLKILLASLQQGYRTSAYPKTTPLLPDRFRGLPVLDRANCPHGCSLCIAACPTAAISDGPNIDLGRCLFCGACSRVCPSGAIRFSQDYRLSVRKREHLVLGTAALELASALDKKSKSLFGRSLKLRQVSAGGCNACEADTNVLSTVVYDLGRFGIQFVASPRHADGLLITGPVSNNMLSALKKTYDAVAWPKLVIAVGACALSGGIYRDHPEVKNGADQVLPVDLYVPGCPPHPLTILDGLLRLLGKI
jgi:Ni,Fe-hydrogenase III small subunit/NAD-dependent dihydropyrimidine dehydrogenase PreA subunit